MELLTATRIAASTPDRQKWTNKWSMSIQPVSDGGLPGGLTAAAACAAKPAARLRLGLHSALMLGDPRFGVRFGFEHADPDGISIRDADLDSE